MPDTTNSNDYYRPRPVSCRCPNDNSTPVSQPPAERCSRGEAKRAHPARARPSHTNIASSFISLTGRHSVDAGGGGQKGELQNRSSHGGSSWPRFTMPSWLDSQKSVLCATTLRLPNRALDRDEIREVAPGHLLGIVLLWDTKKLIPSR